jgi:phenylacetate-CoA ligase
MVGFLDPADKAREFEAADIYLNTNRIDNMPVSVLEACASGVPIVATRIGGVPYLLSHGETALLVRSDDAPAMAEAVLTLLRDPALAARLSSNGLALAARSAAGNVLPRWSELIDRVMAARKRSAA